MDFDQIYAIILAAAIAADERVRTCSEIARASLPGVIRREADDVTAAARRLHHILLGALEAAREAERAEEMAYKRVQ